MKLQSIRYIYIHIHNIHKFQRVQFRNLILDTDDVGGLPALHLGGGHVFQRVARLQVQVAGRGRGAVGGHWDDEKKENVRNEK